MQPTETRSSFLWRNLLRGLAWFAVILTAYILAAEELAIYEKEINAVGDRLPLLLTIFTISEVVFGIIPPEFFMLIWQSKGILSEYVLNLTYLTLISYAAGVLGYYIGRYFSKTVFYQRIHQRYLAQYDEKLRTYGLYLVLVGAITPNLYAGGIGAHADRSISPGMHFPYYPLCSLWVGGMGCAQLLYSVVTAWC
jgi:uncharacterized membrane protein YdjX (TVP38/TMEM64 family)